jgi:hypothetical protein
MNKHVSSNSQRRRSQGSKLSLKREIVRTLTRNDLTLVVAGAETDPFSLIPTEVNSPIC